MTLLRQLVFEALDNAVENGYGENIMDVPVHEVAFDLYDCDADVAGALGTSDVKEIIKALGPLVADAIDAYLEKSRG